MAEHVIFPVTAIVVPAVAADTRGAGTLAIEAGANVTLSTVKTGRKHTLTIAATGGGGSGLTQPQVLARISMGF
jgi:hypothetical protein